MKIAVFGIGGIGGLVGGALARKNAETYFIARGKTLEAIRSRGLQVESALLGDFTVRPKEAAESAGRLRHDGRRHNFLQRIQPQGSLPHRLSDGGRGYARRPAAQRRRSLRHDEAAASSMPPCGRSHPRLQPHRGAGPYCPELRPVPCHHRHERRANVRKSSTSLRKRSTVRG